MLGPESTGLPWTKTDCLSVLQGVLHRASIGKCDATEGDISVRVGGCGVVERQQGLRQPLVRQPFALGYQLEYWHASKTHYTVHT